MEGMHCYGLFLIPCLLMKEMFLTLLYFVWYQDSKQVVVTIRNALPDFPSLHIKTVSNFEVSS